MKTKSIVLLLMMFVTVLSYSQDRKEQHSESMNPIRFEFKEGIQKVKIPNSSSYLTLDIKGRNLDVVGVTRTEKGKAYRLKKTEFRTCSFKNACAVSCWKDSKTNQCICISKVCNESETMSDGEVTGQLEFLSPN